MKNTKLILKAMIATACAINLAACSAETKSALDSIPKYHPPKESPKSQTLKTSLQGDSKPKTNSIYVKNLKSGVQYDFEFSSKQTSYLTWFENYRSADLSCDFGLVQVKAKWLEIKGSKVVETSDWNIAKDSVLAEKGKKYVLSLSIDGVENCKEFGLGFSIYTEKTTDPQPVTAAELIKEENLVINHDYDATTDKRSDSMYFDYNYSPSSDISLYLAYTSQSVSNDCSAVFAANIEWLTLNDNGKVLTTMPVNYSTDMQANAYAHYKLRVWINKAKNCSSFDYMFSVSH